MSITISVYNTKEDRPATTAEIQKLFLNCWNEGSGKADIDFLRPNGCACDPWAEDLVVEIVKS